VAKQRQSQCATENGCNFVSLIEAASSEPLAMQWNRYQKIDSLPARPQLFAQQQPEGAADAEAVLKFELQHELADRLKVLPRRNDRIESPAAIGGRAAQDRSRQSAAPAGIDYRRKYELAATAEATARRLVTVRAAFRQETVEQRSDP
jgi:hypothetical protein